MLSFIKMLAAIFNGRITVADARDSAGWGGGVGSGGTGALYPSNHVAPSTKRGEGIGALVFVFSIQWSG